MDTKAFWKSTAFWGALAFIAGTVFQQIGWNNDPNAAAILHWISADGADTAEKIGALLMAIGRLRANAKLGIKDKPAPSDEPETETGVK